MAVKQRETVLPGREIDLHRLIALDEYHVFLDPGGPPSIDFRQFKNIAVQVQRVRVAGPVVDDQA
jgi:hypothetical protein